MVDAHEDGELLPLLDVLVGPVDPVVRSLIQYGTAWPMFTWEYLRAALSRQDVRDLAFRADRVKWWFRWDNAGRVDTVMRSLGYEIIWEDRMRCNENGLEVWWAQAGDYRRLP